MTDSTSDVVESANDGRRWVDDAYVAATVDEISNCFVAEVKPAPRANRRSFLTVQTPGGLVDALSLGGDVVAAGTRGRLVIRENIYRTRETKRRFVLGTVAEFQPYWFWKIVSTLVPNNAIDACRRQQAEIATPDDLVESLYIKHDLIQLAHDFIKHATVTRRANGMDEICRLPIAYLMNTESGAVAAVYIKSAEIQDWFAFRIDLRVAMVEQVDPSIIHPFNVGRCQRSEPPMLLDTRLDEKGNFVDQPFTAPTMYEVASRICDWHRHKFPEGVWLADVLGWSEAEMAAWADDVQAIPKRRLPTIDEIKARSLRLGGTL